MRSPLSKPDRAAETVREIRNYIVAHGWAPTYRELCDLLGVSSLQTAQRRIDEAVEAGYVIRGEHYQPRTLYVTPLGETVC